MFLIFNNVSELLILNMYQILNIHIAYVKYWGVRLHYKKGRPYFLSSHLNGLKPVREYIFWQLRVNILDDSAWVWYAWTISY